MGWIDMYDGQDGPRRGDILQSHPRNDPRKSRTYLVLRSRLMNRRQSLSVPRYKLWAVRWWELEPEMRMALWRSACRRPEGQRVIDFYRYPAKKKKTFEDYMRRTV